jgi:hypothetical protein
VDQAPTNREQEFVIGGYIPGAHGFDALLVGIYENKQLIFGTPQAYAATISQSRGDDPKQRLCGDPNDGPGIPLETACFTEEIGLPARKHDLFSVL